MKLVISNAAGINDPARFHRAISEAKKADVFLYQETKLKGAKITEVRLKHGYHEGVYMASHPEGSRRGVLTLFNPRLQVTHMEHIADQLGQYLINVVILSGHRMLIVNVYGDPDLDASSLATLERLHQDINYMLNQYDISSIIMGGDFNMVLHDTDTRSTSRKPNAARKLEQMVDDLDIHDVALIHEAEPAHTWFRRGSENVSARYDRLYCSPELIPGAKINRLPRQDDHHPVQLVVLEENMGPGLWMFDDRMLNSEEFKTKIKDKTKEAISRHCDVNTVEIPVKEVQNCIPEGANFFDVLSDVVKAVILLAKQEMKLRKKEERDRAKEALDKLIQARDTYNNTQPSTDEATAAFEEAKMEYRRVLLKRSDRAREVNHLRYTTLGEKMTGYHFAMMKRGRPSREIRQLNVENPPRNIRGQELIEHMRSKYEEISKKDMTVQGPPEYPLPTYPLQKFMNWVHNVFCPKCPQDLEDLLSANIEEDDIQRVVNQMKNQSAPGPLGISNRLLKHLLPYIKRIMAKAANQWLFEDQELVPPEWLAHKKVVFILKPGRDAKLEDSYRGLSMLENIYKAISKIMADRLSLALLAIQDPNQFGFTRQKGTLEASRTVIDIISEAYRQGKPMVIISTDLYKAFDTVDRAHICNCLELYEFPATFKRAYQRLTSRATAVFEINRTVSEQVVIERGTGQGDPISTGTFNLAITPLDYFLSNDPGIPRLQLNGINFPPVSYADDKILLLKGENLRPLLDTIQKIVDYGAVSGLRLNLAKCEVMTAHCNPDIVGQLIQQTGMKLTNSLKHLGLRVKADGKLDVESNLTPITRKMEAIADTYSTAMSTPIGRAIYVKYLCSSRYLHVIQNRYITEDEAKKLREAALKMAWTKPRHDQDPGYRVHVAKDRVAQKPKFGGMDIPDPMIQKKALAMQWLRKIRNGSEEMLWYQLLSGWLEREERPSPEEHLKLGHLEWERSAEKLEGINKYWADVFHNIADIVIATNKVHQHWHLLPLLGSSQRNSEETIVSLRYSNPGARTLYRAGLKNVGMLFHVNEAGYILPNRSKNTQELEEVIDRQIPLLMMNSIAALIREVKQDYRQKVQSVPVPQMDTSPLLELMNKYGSGCSALTEVLLAAERKKWPWGEAPRAFSTYQADGMVDLSQEEYSNAFVRVRASLLPPSTQWTSSQVLYRTLWTSAKEANTRRAMLDGTTAVCKNCLDPNSIENTKHLLYDCTLAKEVLTFVTNSINDIAQLVEGANPNSVYPLTLNPYMVLFHKLPRGMKGTDRTDIEDIMMVVKHVLYKLKFRDVTEQQPNFGTVMRAIDHDLQMHLRVLNYKVKSAPMMRSLIAKIENET